MDEEEIDETAIENEDFVELKASPREVRVRTWEVVLWVVGTYLLCLIPFILFLFLPIPYTTVINGSFLLVTYICARIYGELYVRNYRALITEKGILVRWGAITRHRAMIHHHRITDFSVHKGILQRIFGVYSIRIQTAGTGWAEGSLIGVTDPEPIIKFLKKKIETNAAKTGVLGDLKSVPTSRILNKNEAELLEEILGEIKTMNRKLDKITK